MTSMKRHRMEPEASGPQACNCGGWCPGLESQGRLAWLRRSHPVERPFGLGWLLAGIVLLWSQDGTLAQPTAPAIEWQRNYGGDRSDQCLSLRAASDGGYLIGAMSFESELGNKTSPKFGGDDYWVLRLDAQGEKLWEQSFGGSSYDWLSQGLETPDGGWVLIGQSASGVSGNRTAPQSANDDVWIVRVDKYGTKLWDRAYGGTIGAGGHSILNTADGGFVLGAGANTGVGGDKTSPGFGLKDIWIVKLDGAGNKLWEQCYGGTNIESTPFMRPTRDGGFIVGALSDSGTSGNKTTSFPSGVLSQDYWVLKLDALGQKTWEVTLGGAALEIISDVCPTKDGGYVVAGWSRSGADGNKTSPNLGEDDIWIVRLDAEGHVLWDRTYGGSSGDRCYNVIEPWGGGILVGGQSRSGISGTKTTPQVGDQDFWLVRLDELGNQLWDRTIGGSLTEYTVSLIQDGDGGYVMAGSSVSGISGDKTLGNYGNSDVWVLKLRPDVVTLHALPQTAASLNRDGFRFQLSGPQDTYVLDYAEGDSVWVPFQTNVLSGNAMVVLDEGAGNAPGRVYRARSAGLELAPPF